MGLCVMAFCCMDRYGHVSFNLSSACHFFPSSLRYSSHPKEILEIHFGNGFKKYFPNQPRASTRTLGEWKSKGYSLPRAITISSEKIHISTPPRAPFPQSQIPSRKVPLLSN